MKQEKTLRKPVHKMPAKKAANWAGAMRVLICGDREWRDHLLMEWVFRRLNPDALIIHGACKSGADWMAENYAKKFEMDYMGFPAKWQRHGKPAGPIRNNRMLKEAKPDLVLAFHNDIEKSKGTAHMVKIARASGIQTEVISR